MVLELIPVLEFIVENPKLTLPTIFSFIAYLSIFKERGDEVVSKFIKIFSLFMFFSAFGLFNGLYISGIVNIFGYNLNVDIASATVQIIALVTIVTLSKLHGKLSIHNNRIYKDLSDVLFYYTSMILITLPSVITIAIVKPIYYSRAITILPSAILSYATLILGIYLFWYLVYSKKFPDKKIMKLIKVKTPKYKRVVLTYIGIALLSPLILLPSQYTSDSIITDYRIHEEPIHNPDMMYTTEQNITIKNRLANWIAIPKNLTKNPYDLEESLIPLNDTHTEVDSESSDTHFIIKFDNLYDTYTYVHRVDNLTDFDKKITFSPERTPVRIGKTLAYATVPILEYDTQLNYLYFPRSNPMNLTCDSKCLTDDNYPEYSCSSYIDRDRNGDLLLILNGHVNANREEPTSFLLEVTCK